MTFLDIEFPAGVQFGSAGGPGWSTVVHESASGHEWRNANDAQARHRLSPIKGFLTGAQAAELKSFVLATHGSLLSFPVTDWADYTTNADGITAPTALDQVLGVGDGTNARFQLVKAYRPASPGEYVRTLTLPVLASIAVAVNGTPTAAWTVSATGLLTLTTPPTAGAIVTAGCQFRMPGRFTKAVDDGLQLQAIGHDRYNAVSLGIVEVKDEVEYPDRVPPGGQRNWGPLTSDVSVAFLDGVLQYFQANAAVNLFLPPATYHPGGQDVFVFFNDALATNVAQVRDDSGNAVGGTIAAGAARQIGLAWSGSTYRWVAY